MLDAAIGHAAWRMGYVTLEGDQEVPSLAYMYMCRIVYLLYLTDSHSRAQLSALIRIVAGKQGMLQVLLDPTSHA